MGQKRGGVFPVWLEDDFLNVGWTVRHVFNAPIFEATISKPHVGSQGTEDDPQVDVTMTLGHTEINTLGAVEITGKNRAMLWAAIDRAVEKGRQELSGS